MADGEGVEVEEGVTREMAGPARLLFFHRVDDHSGPATGSWKKGQENKPIRIQHTPEKSYKPSWAGEGWPLRWKESKA